MKTIILSITLLLFSLSTFAQRTPEEKLSMAFYALHNMYVDSVDVNPIVEEQLRHLMLALDPHSEYLSAADAFANEQMLLRPTASSVPNDAWSAKTVVGAKMLDKRTAYVRITMFNQGTVDEFHAAIDSLSKLGMKSLVLDIRQNGGGFFDTALEVADEFLPKGTLMVTTQGAHSPKMEVRAQKDGVFEKGKLVLLVDGGTMSASEIFAGAIQDHHRGVLVGSRTFGKGLVQETYEYSDGSALRLSVARYFTPSGRCIQKPYKNISRSDYFSVMGGIVPEISAESLTDEQIISKALELIGDSKAYNSALAQHPYTASWTAMGVLEIEKSKNREIEKSRNSLTINGKLMDRSYDGRYMHCYVTDVADADHVQDLDSALVENGKFSMSLSVPVPGTLAHLRFANIAGNDHFATFDATFILEEGKLTVTYDSLGYYLKGTPFNNDYEARIVSDNRTLLAKQRAINAERNMLQDSRTLSNEENEKFNEQIKALYDEHFLLMSSFLKDNIAHPFASSLLFSTTIDRYPEADRDFLLANCDQDLRRRIEERDRLRREKQEYFRKSADAMGLGAHYREILARTPDGTEVKLSDYITLGHVTLLDFWASWCVPCQQEIPELKEIYAKHHPDGFDIISISLDTKEAAWLKAVDKNDMPWLQISDLKGWDGTITQDYAIAAIPYLLLLDDNGNIILKNMHGHLLREAIEEAMSKLNR